MTPPALAASPSRLTVSLMLMCAFFVASGIAHFIRPAMYMRIMPPWLPAPLALVLVSGVFEALGGVGVLIPATRVAAGWGIIVLLVAVFPANIQMLLNAHAAHASKIWQGMLVTRLPAQPLLIYWVYVSAIRPA
ncbi:MAG: DoxX family protein [bacterium]